MRPELLRIAPEVQQALSTGRPVVALDSTVIAHEIPRPANLEVVQEAEEVAACFAAKQSLGLDGGLLVGVPLSESDAVPDSVIQAAVDSALERSHTEKIAGKALTPFVLAAIDELIGGKSQQANIALVKNNARLGAEIAVGLAPISGGIAL